MIEKIGIPQAPADKPGGSGSKNEPLKPAKKEPMEHPRGKMKWLDRNLVGKLTKAGRREIRQERNKEQREKESREHLSEPEALRRRLKEFDAALYYVPSAEKPVTNLLRLLYKKARTLKLPSSGDERTSKETALADEAREYLFTGLMPRGEELLDALTADERGRKSRSELRHMREINDRTVRRHVRKYLEWRWMEADWKARWDAWQRSVKEKQDEPVAQMPSSFPKWEDALKDWIRVRNEHVRQKVTNEPPRPPSPPEQLLIIRIAKRIGEDHRTWKVTPVKPDIAT